MDNLFENVHIDQQVPWTTWNNVNETAEGCPAQLYPWIPLRNSMDSFLEETRLCVAGCCQACGTNRKYL